MRLKTVFTVLFTLIAVGTLSAYAEKISDNAYVQDISSTAEGVANTVYIGRMPDNTEYLIDGDKNILAGPFAYISDYGTYPYAYRADGSKILFDRDGTVLADIGAEAEAVYPHNGIYATYTVDENENIHDFTVYDQATRQKLCTFDGYIGITSEFQTEKMFLSKDGKCAIVNKYGEFITDFIYDGVKKVFNPDWEPFPKSYAIVVQNGKDKYIDWNLNEIDLDNYNGAPFVTNCSRITNGDYETPYKNYYEVESGADRHGIYDADSGTYVMPLQDKYRYFTMNDLGIFAQLNPNRGEGGGYGLLDMSGNVIMPFEYSILAPSRFYDFIIFSKADGDSSVSGYYDLKRGTVVYSGGGVPVIDGVFVHSYKSYDDGTGVYCSEIENAAGHNLTGEIYHPAVGYENGKFYNAGYTDNPPEIHVGLDFAVIKVNGKYLDFDGIIRNDRTLVPVRDIIEALGGTVDYSDSDKSVHAALGGRIIDMRIDSAVMSVDGAEKALDVPAQLIDEKTMLPLRALAESAGFTVDWDERIKCVYISGAE